MMSFNFTLPGCHGNKIRDKMGYNSACVRDICEIFVYTWVFGDGPANAANWILPQLTLVATKTKFGTKWAITRHMYEISPRFLRLTASFLKVEQINNFIKSTTVDSRWLGNESCRIFAKKLARTWLTMTCAQTLVWLDFINVCGWPFYTTVQ